MLSCFNCVRLLVTLWTLLSMGFSRQEYWSGLPCPTPGDLLNTGIQSESSYSSCIGREVLHHWATWEPTPTHPKGSRFSLNIPTRIGSQPRMCGHPLKLCQVCRPPLRMTASLLHASPFP